ncbi:MAG: hypothetical protein IJ730_00650, partial [Alphaproteobacteria bacterium]|nr:hypothetical protein [Alphaproteobacteria bacterium]
MKKFAICALSIGIMLLGNTEDTKALFGSSKPAANSPQILIFGASVENLQTKGTNLYKGINTIKKELDSATTKIMKLSVDPKVYDETSQISTGVFIATRLQDISNVFGTIIRKLMRETEGLKLISKAKKEGNADEISGRRSIRLATDLGALMEPMLCDIQAGFAFIGKLCKLKTNRMANSGEIKTVINKLAESVAVGKKTQLLTLFSEYEKEINALIESIKDKEMLALYRNSLNYAYMAEEIIKEYVELVNKMNKYATSGKADELVQFGLDCERKLGSMPNTNSQHSKAYNTQRNQIDEDINNIYSTNRRNNDTIRNRLNSNQYQNLEDNLRKKLNDQQKRNQNNRYDIDDDMSYNQRSNRDDYDEFYDDRNNNSRSQRYRQSDNNMDDMLNSRS